MRHKRKIDLNAVLTRIASSTLPDPIPFRYSHQHYVLFDSLLSDSVHPSHSFHHSET